MFQEMKSIAQRNRGINKRDDSCQGYMSKITP